MKFIVLALCVSFAFALPAPDAPTVEILQQDNVQDDFGQYASQFLSSDGTRVQERGQLKSGPEGQVIVKEGSYSYISPEGSTYSLSYTADENGYQPSAAHLPVAPVA